jgi:hypothetical protein
MGSLQIYVGQFLEHAPADCDAILRLAATLPDDLSEIDIYAEYSNVEEKTRGGSKTEEEHGRDHESKILDPADPKNVN